MTGINIGCGQTPTEGFRNFDNSVSLRLAKIPCLGDWLRKAGLLDARQYGFIKFAAERHIEYGDVLKGLPVASGSADVVYCSHMIALLDREEADVFLKEVARVLASGGVFRVSIPDFRRWVSDYLETGDIDEFQRYLALSGPKPKTLLNKLRLALAGTRQHYWLYDGPSLCRLLEKHGFWSPAILAAGETLIADPGGLDLREREGNSVYVEARKP
jgi:SAM-dependent methyltransferase